MTSSEVSVLLCQVGELVIGVDCADVHRIVPDAGSADDRASARRLFGRSLHTERGARTLVVQHDAGPRVVVERVLGIRSIPLTALKPLPPSVRALGAAAWLLGVAELGERFVWLVDLACAKAEPVQEAAT